MGEMEETNNYMMYQNADGSSYGYVQSDPVTYAPPVPDAAATAPAATAEGGGAEKATNGEEVPKELTELEKYWKAVKDNPHDFTGWTYLLQFVEQENNLDNARDAFQEFFKNYPYCYGYWKKYADLEKKNNNIDKCIEVFEQGLAAIPLSVDLWQHYISFYRTQHTGDDAEVKTRALFENAIKAVGLEFRSDRLWEMYVAFETENRNPRNTMAIFERLITTPTQLYSHQFEIFEEFARVQHPQDILGEEELTTLQQEVEAKRERARLKDEEKTRVREERARAREDKSRVKEEKDADKTKEDETEKSDSVKEEKIAEDADMINDDTGKVNEASDKVSVDPVTVAAETLALGQVVPTDTEMDTATTASEPTIAVVPSSGDAVEAMSVDETAVVAPLTGGGDDALAVTDGKSDVAVTEPPREESVPAVDTCAMPPVVKESVKLSDEDVRGIRQRLMETRRAIHKANEEEVSKRWNFEEGIKRPYFHVKPLETTQLNNWREYLDFEILAGNRKRICILFERCLIACALYEDLWIKYAKYLEAIDLDAARDVYCRACTIHLTSKPSIQLMWASLEERLGHFDKSSEVLDQMEKNFPGYLPITFRRINLTRRQNNLVGTELLYKQYAEAAKSPQIASLYALKQARFRHKLLNDEAGAVAILNEALTKDKDNARLYMQLIDIYYQSTPIREELVVKTFDGALGSDMAIEAKILFAQRKVEFLEDLSSDIIRLQGAYNDLSSFVKAGAEKRKRTSNEGGEEPSPKRARSEAMNGVVASPAPTAVPVAAVAAAVAPAVDHSAAYGYNWANYAAAQNYNYQNAWNVYGQQYYSQQ